MFSVRVPGDYTTSVSLPAEFPVFRKKNTDPELFFIGDPYTVSRQSSDCRFKVCEAEFPVFRKSEYGSRAFFLEGIRLLFRVRVPGDYTTSVSLPAHTFEREVPTFGGLLLAFPYGFACWETRAVE